LSAILCGKSLPGESALQHFTNIQTHSCSYTTKLIAGSTCAGVFTAAEVLPPDSSLQQMLTRDVVDFGLSGQLSAWVCERQSYRKQTKRDCVVAGEGASQPGLKKSGAKERKYRSRVLTVRKEISAGIARCECR